jgi:hypothetical protein
MGQMAILETTNPELPLALILRVARSCTCSKAQLACDSQLTVTDLAYCGNQRRSDPGR